MPREDWERDPAWLEFQHHALTEMLPKLAGSDASISIMPTDEKGDVKYWVELGASIMLDKPIIVLAAPGRKVPKRLRRVADKVIVVDLSTPLGQAEAATLMQDAMAEVIDGDAE